MCNAGTAPRLQYALRFRLTTVPTMRQLQDTLAVVQQDLHSLDVTLTFSARTCEHLAAMVHFFGAMQHAPPLGLDTHRRRAGL